MPDQRKDLEEKKLSSEGYEEEVKARAQSAGIDMLRDVVEVIDDLDGGYVGKTKGITEIAWERVFFTKQMLKDKVLFRLKDCIRMQKDMLSKKVIQSGLERLTCILL